MKEPRDLGSESAFPVPFDDFARGLTIRQLFTLGAMVGLCAGQEQFRTFEILAKEACRVADTQLAELEKGP